MANQLEEVNVDLDYTEDRQLQNAGTHFLLIIASVLAIAAPVWALYSFGYFTNFTELLSPARIAVTVVAFISLLLVWSSYIKISSQLRHRHTEMWEARDQLSDVINRHQEVTTENRNLSDTFSKTKARHYFELIEMVEAQRNLLQGTQDAELQELARRGLKVLQSNNFSIWFFTESGKLNYVFNFDSFTQQEKQIAISPEMVQVAKLVKDPSYQMPEASEVQALKAGAFTYKSKRTNALCTPIQDAEGNLIGMCWSEAAISENWGERKQQLGNQIASMISTVFQENTKKAEWETRISDLKEAHNNKLKTQEKEYKDSIQELNDGFYTLRTQLEQELGEKDERIEHLYTARGRYRTLFKEANFGATRFKLREAVSTDNIEEAAIKLLEESYLTILNPAGEDILQLESNVVEGKPLGVLIEYPKLHNFVKAFIEEGLHAKEEVWEYENEKGEMQYIQLTLFATLDNNELSGIWLLLNDLTSIRLISERYKSIFDTTQQMITVMDRDFQILYENPALVHHLGYENREGKAFLSFLHPEDFEKVEGVLNAMIRGEEEDEDSLLSIRILNSEEKWTTVDLKIYNLLDNTEVRAIILEASDNTERALFEQELQTETDFYKTLVENKDEVITVVDQNGFIRYENPAMERLFGYDKGMRIGSYGLEYVHTEDVEDLDKFFQKAKESEDTTLEKYVQFIDVRGNWREVLVSMKKLKASQNGNSELMLTFKDIGKQEANKRTELEQQKLFRSLVQHSQCVYLVTNSLGKVLFASDSIRKVLGFNPKELLNKEISKLVGEDYITTARDIVRNLNSDPQGVFHKEVKFRNTHREWRNVKVYASSLFYKGHSLGLMFQLEDITDQLREQSELSFRSRFYRALVNSASYYLIFTDYNQHIKFVNPAAKDQLGYQLKGKLSDWLYSEDQKLIDEEWNNVVENHDYILETTVRLMNQEGAWEYFLLKGQNALKNSSFKGVLLECRMLDKKAVEQIDRSIDRQVGRALQSTNAVHWGLLNNRQELIASSENFFEKWNGDGEELGLRNQFQEGDLRDRFQRMVRREGDIHEVLTLDSGENYEVNVSTTQKGVMVFVEKQPLEVQAFPELAATEQKQRVLLEELPLGMALIDKNGAVISINTKATELLGITDSIYLSEHDNNFVKLTDFQHFTSIVAEAKLHPGRVCEGNYLMNLTEGLWKEVFVSIKSIDKDNNIDYYVLWVEESKEEKQENVIIQQPTVELENNKALVVERDKWRAIALEEVDKQRELNNQLWLYRKQALEQQTRAHYGELAFGTVGKAKLELEKATRAWQQMKQYYHDLRALIDGYQDISVETNIFNKLQEIRMLKNEVDFEELYPNMNAQVEDIRQRISSSEEQLDILLKIQNEDITEKVEFKPFDLFIDIKETFKNHPQSMVYFLVPEDDGEVVVGSYFRLHQLICSFIHAVQDVFTIEEVQLLDGRNEEHSYLEIIVDVYEEDIPSVKDWFNDTKSAESLNVWIARSLMIPYEGNIYIETLRGNRISIIIGLE